MTRIELPCGRFFSIDEGDIPLLNGRHWVTEVRGRTVYVRGRKPGQQGGGVYLHSLIVGGMADHRDGNGLDNRRSNLRPCTQPQNNLNRGPKRGKRFKGVYRQRSSFYAQIYINRRSHYSGGHTSEEEAARAYDRMAIALHGEFARLNFPKEAT